MFPKNPPKKTVVFGDFDPVNQRNLKALENGGTVEVWQWGKVVAIGSGHKPDVMEFARAGKRASITITKGTLTDPGTLEVHGQIAQGEFTDAMKRISKKKVVFK